MKKRIRHYLGGALTLVFVAGIMGSGRLHAQTSFGTIVGSVTDPSKAAIPDVSITVTNVDTGNSRQVKTNLSGDYRVESLLPGVYKVSAEAQNFQRTEVSSVTLPVAVTVTINIELRLGTTSQTVEVTATSPLLETANATLGNVVNNTSVVTLPLNGRNFTDLIQMVPGSVPNSPIFLVSGGTNYSVSGNRAEQNNFTLDGVYNNEEFFKQFSIQPSIDAIQEFKIQTNITSSEYGQAAGANINVAIKSGTNAIHGSVFEFLRNEKLDAIPWFRNYNSTPANPAQRVPSKRNQYGFVVGGPVVIPKLYNGRNRTFWLFNFEGIKRREASTLTSFIPTLEQFSGDLSDQPTIYDPNTTCGFLANPACTDISGPAGIGIPDGVVDSYDLTRQAFAGNIIPPARINSFVRDYIPIFYPQISAPGQANVRIVNSSPFTLNQAQWTTRIDHKIKDSLSFFSRFSMSNADQVSASSLPIVQTIQSNNFRNFVASWTWVPTPTTVFDLKLGYNRSNLQIATTEPSPGWAAFLDAHPIQGTPVKNAKIPLFPPLFLDEGGFAFPDQTAFPFPTNQYQVLLTVSKITGKHSLKVGMDFTDMRNLDDGNFTSHFHFNSVPTRDPQNPTGTGSVLASYLLGLPSSGLRNLGETQAYMRQPRYHFFVQDDIKLTRKLTVNIGLRYEYNKWPVDRWDRVGGFDRISGQYLWSSTNPITGEAANVRRGIRDPDWNNYAPRVGLAYQITPNTTFRSGYGIFYVANQLWEGQGSRGNWPYAISETKSSTNLLIPDSPLLTFFSPDILPGPTSPVSSQHVLGRRDRTAYSQQWHGGIQRQLAADLLFELDYVGSRGVKQALFTNINSALPGPGLVGTAAHPRPYGNELGAMSEMSNSASSIYHSMQIKVEKRFSNGLQFLSSYAWGKNLDLGGSGFANSVAPQNPEDPHSDRAPSIFDFRHVWNISYVYQLPFGRGKRYFSSASGVVNGLVGGWEVTGLTRYNTGGPINVGMGEDVANIGPRSGGQRPDRIGPSIRAIDPNDKTKGWLLGNAFARPADFTFGNLGRNTERAPGYRNWNVGLYKNFPLSGENRVIQFRTEFYNAFNNVSLGGYNASFCEPIATCNPNFGRISSTQSVARQIQFALKFLF